MHFFSMAKERLDLHFTSLIGLALCLAPFQYFPWIPGAGVYDNQRLLTTACALIAAGVVFFHLCIKPAASITLRKRTLSFVGIFLFAGCISSFLAPSTDYALFEVATLILLFFISWLISVNIKKSGDPALNLVLLWCGLACAIYLIVHLGLCLYALVQGIQPKLSQLFFGYNNHRFFNHVQTISLPLLVLFALRMEDLSRRYFWLGITVFWWALLFASGGRGSIVSLIFGSLLCGLLIKRDAMVWLKFFLSSAFIGLGVFFLLYVWIPTFRHLQPFGVFFDLVKRSIDNPTSSRLPLWSRALELISDNPFFGIGPGHFSYHSADLEIAAHPHNWILQFASEWGVPALLALLVVMYFCLASLVKLKSHAIAKDQLAHSAFLTGALAIIMDSMVSGLIVFPVSQLWLAVFFGTAWGWLSYFNEHESVIKTRYNLVFRAILLITIGFICMSIVNLVISRMDQISRQPELTKDEIYFMPRIFMDGRVQI